VHAVWLVAACTESGQGGSCNGGCDDASHWLGVRRVLLHASRSSLSYLPESQSHIDHTAVQELERAKQAEERAAAEAAADAIKAGRAAGADTSSLEETAKLEPEEKDEL
jgi:hypothetical protein